jgi:hypothetical protein
VNDFVTGILAGMIVAVCILTLLGGWMALDRRQRRARLGSPTGRGVRTSDSWPPRGRRLAFTVQAFLSRSIRGQPGVDDAGRSSSAGTPRCGADVDDDLHRSDRRPS